MSVTSVTATSMSLSWSVPSDSVVTSYEVMWRETDSGATEMTSGSLTNNSYTIEQLDSNTNYTIIVITTNIAGSTESLPFIFYTGNAVACLPFFTFFPHVYTYTACRFKLCLREHKIGLSRRLHYSYRWWSGCFEPQYGSDHYYSDCVEISQRSYCSTKEVCYAMWIDIQTHFPMQQQRGYIKHYR